MGPRILLAIALVGSACGGGGSAPGDEMCSSDVALLPSPRDIAVDAYELGTCSDWSDDIYNLSVCVQQALDVLLAEPSSYCDDADDLCLAAFGAFGGDNPDPDQIGELAEQPLKADVAACIMAEAWPNQCLWQETQPIVDWIASTDCDPL